MNWTPQQYAADRAAARPRARTRPQGRMNATERAYAMHLETQLKAGAITLWQFESVKLRLAATCWYTPDFLVIRDGQIEMHEVKGFWRDDARVKWKTAAETFWWAGFVAITRVKGVWHYEWYGNKEDGT